MSQPGPFATFSPLAMPAPSAPLNLTAMTAPKEWFTGADWMIFQDSAVVNGKMEGGGQIGFEVFNESGGTLGTQVAGEGPNWFAEAPDYHNSFVGDPPLAISNQAGKRIFVQNAANFGGRFSLPADRAIRSVNFYTTSYGATFRAKCSFSDGKLADTLYTLPTPTQFQHVNSSFNLRWKGATQAPIQVELRCMTPLGNGDYCILGLYVVVLFAPIKPPTPKGVGFFS